MANSCLVCKQFTKVSSHGPGSKPPPKAPSSSSSHPKPNTTLEPLEQATSQLVFQVVSQEVSHKHMPRWASAPA